MQEGDILTHCFSGRRNNILDAEGRLLPAARAAAQRGVIFDVGHGMGSFNFATAAASLAQGLPPTIISSDLHAFSEAYPVIDLLAVLSKFVYVLGLPLADALRRATVVPAKALGLAEEAGSLRVERPADIAVVREVEGEFRLWDADQQSRVSDRCLVPSLTLCAGRVV